MANFGDHRSITPDQSSKCRIGRASLFHQFSERFHTQDVNMMNVNVKHYVNDIASTAIARGAKI